MLALLFYLVAADVAEVKPPFITSHARSLRRQASI